MRLLQEQLRQMFERNKALAKANPVFNSTPTMAASELVFKVAEHSKPNKYRNVKVEYEGMKFDSKHELECWKQLKLREKAGEITDLNRQIKFKLRVNGREIGRFTADFIWLESGSKQVVADAKSPATRKETAYRLRKKIFEAQYAPLTIREL